MEMSLIVISLSNPISSKWNLHYFNPPCNFCLRFNGKYKLNKNCLQSLAYYQFYLLKTFERPKPPFHLLLCPPPPWPTVDSKVLWYKVVQRRLRIGCYVRYLHIAPGCGQAGFFLIKRLRINRRNYKTNNSSFYLQDRHNWKWFEDCSTKGELRFRMFILYSQNKTIPQKNAAQVVQSYIIDILRSPNWSPVIKPFRTHLYFMSLSY